MTLKLGSDFLEMVGESVVDVATDTAVEALQAELNKMFPNSTDPNSIGGKFFQSMKMQITARTQASVMAAAMASQNKFNKKIDDYRETLQEAEKAHKEAHPVKNALSGGKLNQKIAEKTQAQYNQVLATQGMYIQREQSAAKNVTAYTTGLGSTKLAYDNAQGDEKFIIMQNSKLIQELVKGQGDYTPKVV